MAKYLFITVLLFISTLSVAQTIVNRDPVISGMVNLVSADSLNKYVLELVKFGTRNTLSTQSSSVRGIGAARNWVAKKFQEFAKSSGGRLTVIIDTTTLLPDKRRIDTPVLLGNVVATLKGTDPGDSRIFIITAHLDNMRSNVMDRTGDAPGANDDASGVAALLECARIMSRHNFPATIKFVAFSGEEQGLLGARFMAANARRDSLNIAGILNNDIMGSNHSGETGIIDNTRVRVFSEGLPSSNLDKAKNIRQLGLENDGASRQLARYVKETGERYVDHIEVILIYRNDRFLRGGDHSAFVDLGFPAVRITEMNENYKHQHQDVRMEKGIQYGDLPEFMDFEYLRKNTAVNLSSLANLAKSHQPPINVLMEARSLSNQTSISWQAGAANQSHGYYVMIRETSSPVWQRKIFTTQTSVVLPYSKDNYFFAVQSVNITGNESLPVVPGIR